MLKGFIIFTLIATLLLIAFGEEAGSLKVEKDECNPTGVGFSCSKQGKHLKGFKMDAKKVIIVPPRCPAGKRLDQNGKCKTIY